jgi:hypothetical protein
MSRLLVRLRGRRIPGGTRVLVIAGAAVLVIAAAGTALAVWGSGPRPASQAAAVPASGQARATLRVTSGTPLLLIRVASAAAPHGTLVQAQTPSGAPVRPELTTRGGASDTSVDLSLAGSGGSGGSGGAGYPVTVTLSRAVTWSLVFAGGTQRTVADLRGAHVAVLLFTAGSDEIDVTLPRPGAAVPLMMAGGVSRLLVRVPPGVPVRVSASGGAGEVTLDGATQTGVAGGTVLTSPGWREAEPDVDVDATAGASLISVTRWNG